MRIAIRLGFAVVGVAMAVYGTASLTGGWLGTPPWWMRAAPLTEDEWNQRYYLIEFAKRPGPGLPTFGSAEADRGWHRSLSGFFPDDSPSDPWNLAAVRAPRHVEPRSGRAWISGGMIALGVGLATFGVRSRRRRGGIAPLDAP